MRLFGTMFIISLAFSSFSFAEKPDLIIGYKNVYDAEHSHDAEKIAVATNLGIFIFNTESMKLLSYRLFDEGLKYLDWSPNDNYIFASNPDTQENYILDAISLEITAIVNDTIEFHIESAWVSTCLINYDNTVSFNHDEDNFYYLDSHSLNKIDLNYGTKEIIFSSNQGVPYAFGFLENNNEIWISTRDRYIYLYDIITKKLSTILSPQDVYLTNRHDIFDVSKIVNMR